jgi:23S rRNA (uracil1939-C5)-methyltransferase
MIFAKHWAKHVTSVELVTSASKDGEKNAKLNNISNMDFVNAKVEEFLDDYLNEWKSADLLVIDPPRAGMHPDALPNILKFWTKQMIYVSCNPSTLARDLEYILENSEYKIEKVQAKDMFPHTNHIETIVSLVK